MSWIESHKLNSPKMSNILWRDKDLIRINKRLEMLGSIIILANLTALYNPSAHSIRRSITLSPFVGTMSNALAVESRVLRHSQHHCQGHSGQIQPEKDHWLREQNKPSGVLRHFSYAS